MRKTMHSLSFFQSIRGHATQSILILSLALVGLPVMAGGPPRPTENFTLSIPVGVGMDDAEEKTSNGKMSLTSSDLELIQDGSKQQKVGLRFPLEVPSGATILNVTIQFTVDEIGTDSTVLDVSAEAAVNALAFSTTKFDISNRTLITENILWSPPSWTQKGAAGPDQQTPDLSAIVQAVVDQDGWMQGNYIAIIISGNGKRVAESFNGTAAPVLYVEFSTLPPVDEAPVAIDDDLFEIPAYTTGVDQELIVLDGADDIVERNDSVGFPEAQVTASDSTSVEGGVVEVAADGSFSYTPSSGYLGVDSFTYTLSNGVGPISIATVYISVEEVVDLTTLWLPVLTGSDDAEQRLSSGRVSLSSSDLELIKDGSSEQLVGVRFQALNVPQGASIVEAYIQYTADESDTEATNLTVYGEATANALTFSRTAFNISDRALTVANVPWMPAPWNTNEQTSSIQATPDLSTIVQEIVNRADWVSGNPIAFITSGTGKRVAESFNGIAAPVLHVSFSSEPPVLEAPDAVDDDAGGVPAYTTGINQSLILANGADDIVERNDSVGFPIAEVATFGPVTGLESDVSTMGSSATGGAVIVNADGGFSYTPAVNYLGPDSFVYTLTNSEGSDSATVTIEVLNTGEPMLLSVTVIAGSDDAEEDISDGDMNLSSSDLEMIMDKSSVQLVGVRFQGIDVPPGALIEEAYIQYQTDEVSIEQTVLAVSGEAIDNAPTFSKVDFNISTRTPTAASVEWTPPAWNTVGAAGPEQRTSDLSAIVQEIVNRGGWAEGNAMVFMTSGSGNRVAESFNGSAAPELHVVYSIPPPENLAPTATDVLITDTDGEPLAVGDELTGTYTYNDAEDNAEAISTFQWLRDGVPIAGATTETYVLVAEDEGTTITFEVTPVAIGGGSPGEAVVSPSVMVPANVAPVASNVSIADGNGTPANVGDTLNGSYDYNDVNNDPEGTTTFRWLRDGTPIVGAISTTYVPVAEDEGATINFEITPVASSGATPGTVVVSAGVIVEAAVDITYAIGDTGPGGGIVFYVTDDGLNGLEAAPVDLGFAVWGCYESTLGVDGREVGDGAQNTVDILAGCNEAGIAAAVADAYTLDGIDDWFLPSRGALDLMGENLFENGLGDFSASTGYWSSVENELTPDTHADTYYFQTDEYFKQRKFSRFLVHPVRVFGVLVPANMAPVTSNVLITDGNGAPANVGDTLTGSYEYSDENNDPEGTSTFRWLRDGVPIASAIAETYVLVADDEGTIITFEITPVATMGETLGAEVSSAGVLVEPVVVEGPPYDIGDMGPGGGIVFYVTDGGLSGLEAAPVDLGFAVWGCYESTLGVDGRQVGDGAQNTVDILAGCDEAGIAAAVADAYTLDGIDDWFLPSRGALDLMGENLFENGLGDFSASTGYWSSVENELTPDTHADTYYFQTDEYFKQRKFSRFLVHPVRVFGVLVPANVAPVASNLLIIDENGAPVKVGDTLAGSYDYSDDNNDLEGISNFRWLRDGVPIEGATSLTYEPVAEDEGTTLRFEVTPVAINGKLLGTAVSSLGVVMPVNVAPVASNVLITDENGAPANVGDTLTGSYDYSDVNSDPEGVSTFRWSRDGTPITGATNTTYVPVADDEGKTVTFEITPFASSGETLGAVVSSVGVLVEVAGPVYAIGDTGPGGGIVFHVTDGGLHGLEAAPVDHGKASWGCVDIEINGADFSEVEGGAQNTEDILAGCNEAGIAAALADAYTLNGVDDWFLPTIGQMELMDTNLFRKGVGELTADRYWSSSEHQDFSTHAYTYKFGFRSRLFLGKDAILKTRAIRKF